jgi:hypothetical protein
MWFLMFLRITVAPSFSGSSSPRIAVQLKVTAWELSILEICNKFVFYAGRTL